MSIQHKKRWKNTLRLEKQHGLGSQAVGLVPVLVLMALSHFLPHRVAFLVAATCCAGCIVAFGGVLKNKAVLFMLVPATVTLGLYSVFFHDTLEPALHNYSPLITEWILVAVLALSSISRRYVVNYVRKSNKPTLKNAHLQASLTEYFYVAQIIQNLYTLHIFVLLFYAVFFEDSWNAKLDRLLYHEASFLIGSAVVVFEYVRLYALKLALQQEKWLPILDPSGKKVIGRIAQSVSLQSNKKYKHPVVRIAFVCNGMLFLTPRNKKTTVTPETLDYPLFAYVNYKQTPEQTIKKMLGSHANYLKPRLLAKYMFENENVDSYVSLYVVTLTDELSGNVFVNTDNGKLWTKKQIEQNLGKNVFSPYFENEYPYLKNTVLITDNQVDNSNQ